MFIIFGQHILHFCRTYLPTTHKLVPMLARIHATRLHTMCTLEVHSQHTRITDPKHFCVEWESGSGFRVSLLQWIFYAYKICVCIELKYLTGDREKKEATIVSSLNNRNFNGKHCSQCARRRLVKCYTLCFTGYSKCSMCGMFSVYADSFFWICATLWWYLLYCFSLVARPVQMYEYIEMLGVCRQNISGWKHFAAVI